MRLVTAGESHGPARAATVTRLPAGAGVFVQRGAMAWGERVKVGVQVEVRARGVPPGLGSYATKDDRLDAGLAGWVMGTQGVKGVEIGEGFGLASKRGSAAHDEIFRD